MKKRGHRDPEKRQKAWIVTQTTWPMGQGLGLASISEARAAPIRVASL
jgi:hypothetical protein